MTPSPRTAARRSLAVGTNSIRALGTLTPIPAIRGREAEIAGKARRRVAVLHRTVRETRLDHAHKTALRLVRDNQAVYAEDLAVSGLMRTKLARSIAGLVAEGLSNPQIGERLYISRRTVQTHLAHVFAKLDISSRAQLAAEITRQRPGSLHL